MAKGEVWKSLMIMAEDPHFRSLYGNKLNLSINHLFSEAKRWLKDRRQFEYETSYDKAKEFKNSLSKILTNYKEKNVV